MKFSQIQFLFVALFIFSTSKPNNSLAQTRDNLFTLKQLDSRNGISNSAVTNIFQDSDGLLWASTWDGLNVYDGNSFHVFNYTGYQVPNSIGNNVVKQVREDKSGRIWIATMEGISSYEKKTGKFLHYFYQLEHKRSVGGNEYSVTTDGSGNTFCLSKAAGLFAFDQQHNRFQQVRVPGEQAVAKIKFDKKDRLWALGRDGVLSVYKNTDKQLKLLQAYSLAGQVKIFFIFKQNVYFITGDRKFFRIDANLQTQLLCKLQHDVKAMTIYNGHYMLAWTTGGCEILNQHFEHADFLKPQVAYLQSTKITSMVADRNGILWCATDGNGIIRIAQEKRFFGLVNGQSVRDKSMLEQVRAFCEVGNDLWVGTKGSGIIVLKNYLPGKDVPSKAQSLRYPKMLSNNSVYSLLRGNDNLIYIGSDGEGLCLYDEAKQRFIHWEEVEGSSNFPAFASVYSIIQDEDNSLWLGTSGYGLIHLKLARRPDGTYELTAFRQYLYDGTNKGPGNDIIYCVQKGRDGRIWLGCRYGGLSVLNQATHQFRTFRAFSYDGSLSHNDVLSLYLDRDDRLWVGTSYGLNRINEKDATKDKLIFTKLAVKDGLPNNTIHGIIDGGSGYLWISTNKGLARIHPQTLQIERFQESDGLQGNEFSDGAAWQDKNGHLLFGGNFGFNVFTQADISKDARPYNMLLTALQVGSHAINENSLTVVHPGNRKTFQVTAAPGEDYFELNLKPIDLLNQEKSGYAYQLSGYDTSWRYSTENGQIKYSNLPAGNYALLVKSFDGDGTSGFSNVALEIKFRPYLWKSPQAIILYILGGCLLIYAWLAYRKKRYTLKNRLETERLLRFKEDELHKQQLGFFTNIAHELRTPLTLINGSVERFFYKGSAGGSRGKEQQFLSIIHKQSSRLTYLVNQLMDFRKIEAGYLGCRPSHLDLSALLTGIAELFIPITEQKQIDYRINVMTGMEGWVDQDKLEKIVFNLLSNAFKHTTDEQEVAFEITMPPRSQMLNIVISNSGCGLTEVELDYIFDRFYSTDHQAGDQFNSGIGLAYARQLVELLNGEIKASLAGDVISFQVRLPLFQPSVSDVETKPPMSSPEPSYLLRSITANTQEAISVKEINKRSLVANLESGETPAILIVDDEPAIRFLLKDLLEDNFIVYEAETGRQAIELLQVVSVNMVISDVMMPDINGLELCHKVKNTPATCHLPFILLSAKGELDQQTEGYDAGADAYIPKPFDTEHLMIRVKRLLEYRTRLHGLFRDENAVYRLNEKPMSGDDSQFLNKVVELIEANIEDTSLDASFLEAKLSLSRMQLYRKMKTLSNMPPVEFIKCIRLQKAVKYLETTTLTVNEIFYRSGFNNQSHFFREFKKRHGCSPNEYRALQRITV